jgi:hypothetical protein
MSTFVCEAAEVLGGEAACPIVARDRIREAPVLDETRLGRLDQPSVAEAPAIIAASFGVRKAIGDRPRRDNAGNRFAEESRLPLLGSAQRGRPKTWKAGRIADREYSCGS